MQVKINITNEAAIAVRSPVFKQTGKQLKNGTWNIPLDADTYLRLRTAAFAGESLSDTIIRLVALQDKKPN